MYRTAACAARGVATTHHGQRRILKHKLGLLEFIEKSVKAGTFRTREEVAEMNDKLAAEPQELKDVRWNLRRGSKIQDYPFDYHVLSMFPDSLDTGKMPTKFMKYQRSEYMRDDKNRRLQIFVEKYMQRHKKNARYSADSQAAYDKLLGIDFPSRVDTAIGAKSDLLHKAYAFAIKQFEVSRQDPNLSDTETIQKVEDLLKQDMADERRKSRAMADEVRKRREKLNEEKVDKETAAAQHPRVKALKSAQGMYPKGMLMKRWKGATPPTDGGLNYADDGEYATQLYSSDQRAFSGMIAWTYRLQAIPYNKWTVGASTALDHWIAKRVLGLSEATWIALVAGNDPSLLSRGRDIVMARHALFPETISGDRFSQEDEEIEQMAAEAAEESSAISKTSSDDDDIEKLLAALGWEDKDESSDKKREESNKFDWKDSPKDDAAEDEILALVEQLQEWRTKQVATPYEKWSDEQKNEFQLWLRGYVEALVPESSLGTVNLESTRKTLLASPPQTKQDSDNFWSSIRDESAAEEFLERLLEAGPPDDLDDSLLSVKLFWEMPYEQQLDHLINKGAVREMLDEFTSEKRRASFWSRYRDYILEGLVIDHLVQDPNGPISASEISKSVSKRFKIGPDDRFRLEKLPYGSSSLNSESARTARELFREWNKLKAGRAHYEERLYQRSMLGLRYKNKDVRPKQETYDGTRPKSFQPRRPLM